MILKNMKIGTWNITTLKNDYCIDILTDEYRRFELDLLGVSETHIPGVGSMKLGDRICSTQAGRMGYIGREWGSL